MLRDRARRRCPARCCPGEARAHASCSATHPAYLTLDVSSLKRNKRLTLARTPLLAVHDLLLGLGALLHREWRAIEHMGADACCQHWCNLDQQSSCDDVISSRRLWQWMGQNADAMPTASGSLCAITPPAPTRHSRLCSPAAHSRTARPQRTQRTTARPGSSMPSRGCAPYMCMSRSGRKSPGGRGCWTAPPDGPWPSSSAGGDCVANVNGGRGGESLARSLTLSVMADSRLDGPG